MTLDQKFSATFDWLIHAIIEKIENRLPNKLELSTHLGIMKKGGKIKATWKQTVIVMAELKKGENHWEGYFEVPESLSDEFIKERTKNWYNH